MGKVLFQIAGNKEDVSKFLKKPGNLRIIKFKGIIKSGKQIAKVVGNI